MGKSSPQAPAPVDPGVVTQQQQAANAETARLQAQLNRVNQYGPNGSVTYSHGPLKPQVDGAQVGPPPLPGTATGTGMTTTPATGGWVAGGADGQPIWDPHATPNSIVSTAPGPDGQAGATSSTSSGNGTGTYDPNDTWNQITTLSPDQQKLYDQQNQIAQALYGLGASNVSAVQAAQGKPFDTSGAPAAVNGLNYSNLPALKSSVNGGTLQSSVQGGPLTTSVSTPKLQTSFNEVGDVQRTINPTAQGIQYDVADAGPIQKSLADFGRAQSSINNTLGDQTGTFADVGGQQRQLDYSSLGAIPTTQDFSTDRQSIQDALYARQTAMLDPQYQQQERQFSQRLADQGIPLNSEAYNQAMAQFQQNKANAYASARNDAISQSANAQQQMFNEALAARQQGAGEITTAGNFANQAQNTDYTQALGRGTFANTAQNTDFQQAAARTAQNNAALGQDQSYEATKGNFANAAQGQQYGQNANNLTLHNAANAQDYGQNLSTFQAQNAAQQQAYDQALGRSNFANQAVTAQQGLDINAGNFGNQAQQQLFDQGIQNANLGNNAQQIAFGQGISNADLANSARAQSVNEQQANAALANTGRQNYIQEQAYNRSLPINELATLLGTAGGVQMPQFTSAPNTAVQPTDVGSAYALQQQQYQAQLQAQQAANGQLGSLLGTGALAAATYFCFAKGTLISMADGTEMPIEAIRVGDKLSTGRVYKTMQATADGADWYRYGETLVTGMHAVYEDGRFIRVKDSTAILVEFDADVLYSLGVTGHRMEIDGVIFSDFDEVDVPNLPPDVTLAALNMREAA